MKRWMRVRVKVGQLTSQLAIPMQSVGRVVKTDAERSRYGYDVLVCWKKKLPRASWVPCKFLEPA
jgi:hypothetical protein